LLTGLGWPCIYAAAALVHRKRHKRGLGQVTLDQDHAVEVVGLLLPLIYMFWVWFKSSLGVADAVVLVVIYVAYLWLLSHLPPEDQESIDDLPAVPRAVVLARPMLRNLGIFTLFAIGGGLIYFSAEPFLGSLLAVSTMIGVPTFVFVQWIAPFVSEFPEMATAINWARSVDKAPMALMNMVSSNINQWTLLPAMLAVVFSISRGTVSSIPFDSMQELELLMTLGQALVAMSFLVSMSLAWWEALALFAFWFVQMALSPLQGAEGIWGVLAHNVNWAITGAYFAWAGVALVGYVARPRTAVAFHQFAHVWREHVRKA
jgi:cation:H+ antiporter